MEVIFLLGAIQAFFFAILLVQKKQPIKAHQVLMVLFLLTGLVLLDHYLELKELVFEYPHLLGLTYSLPIIMGPVIFLYTLTLVLPKAKVGKFLLMHGAPFLIIFCYFLADFYFLSAEQKLTYYIRESEQSTSTTVYVAEFLLNFSIPSYAFASLLYLRKHQSRIKDRFSSIREVDLKWLRLVLWSFLAISFVMLITNLISDVFPVISFLTGDSVIFGALTLAIFFIGYYGIRQQAIYPSDQPVQSKPYVRSGLKKSDYKLLLPRLETLMTEQQLYLNSKLSLKELATAMNLTENNLSQLINEGKGQRFYDFVNLYRVEAFKQAIKESKYAHLTLLAIAFECGFNSKSSFNAIFKESTGMTPSAYKKTLEN